MHQVRICSCAHNMCTFSCFNRCNCWRAPCIFFSPIFIISGIMSTADPFLPLGLSFGFDLKGSKGCSFLGTSMALNFRTFRSIPCHDNMWEMVKGILRARKGSREEIRAQNLVNRVFVVRNRYVVCLPQLSSGSHALPHLISGLKRSGHKITVGGNFNVDPCSHEDNVTHKNFVLKCAPRNAFRVFPFSP